MQPTSRFAPLRSAVRRNVKVFAAISFSIGSMAPAISKIPAAELHVSKPVWWLESRFHFNFAGYWGGRENFGALRVLNDDLVKPQAGFGRHPHRNAEIFSYVVQGQLSHADSMGNKESLPAGCVQYLSAGTGLTHEEMNDGSKTCRFLQVWLTPQALGVKPAYGSARYQPEERRNVLLQILGGTGAAPAWPTAKQGQPIKLHQDANVYVSETDPHLEQALALGPGRQAYLVCIEGELVVHGPKGESAALVARDAADLVAPASKEALHLTLVSGAKGAHFMIIEMSQRPVLGGLG